jgi:ferredoxin-NADP reductase
VSGHLCGEVRVGDTFELRGPIGGYFVWNVSDGGPLLLVAGGSGIVPLMAMLRHRAAQLPDVARRRALPARLLYSSRRWDDVIYREELEHLAAKDDAVQVMHTITREAPSDWKGFRRRIDRAMLVEIAWPPHERSRAFVCGPTPLVESAATELVALGHDPALVKTERFGPTG